MARRKSRPQPKTKSKPKVRIKAKPRVKTKAKARIKSVARPPAVPGFSPQPDEPFDRTIHPNQILTVKCVGSSVAIVLPENITDHVLEEGKGLRIIAAESDGPGTGSSESPDDTQRRGGG